MYNNSSNNSSNNNGNKLNRLEFVPANGYVQNPNRTIKFKGTRRVRNIPQEGRSIPASTFRIGSKTKTRRHIGQLMNHPTPLTHRFTSQVASRLLANAHANSNSYQQMTSYIIHSNLSKYFPKGFPKPLMNRQIPTIKQKAFAKLNRSYTNLAEEVPPPPAPVGATAPKLPNGNNWTEWFNR